MEPHVYDPEYKVDRIPSEVDSILSVMMVGSEGYGEEYTNIRDEIVASVMEEAIAYTYQLVNDIVRHSDLNPDDQEEFISGVTVRIEGDAILIGLSPSVSWKIRAMEYGCPSFDMKPGLLRNAYATTTKVFEKGSGKHIKTIVGKKFRRVPIKESKFRGYSSGGAGGSSDYQKKVKEAIKASRYRWKKMDELENEDGSFTIFEELRVPKSQKEVRQSTSSLIARTRTYQNRESFETSRRTPDKETVTTFKTVSEDSTGWFHPGFPGKFLLFQVKSDLEANVDNIVASIANILFGEKL